MTLSFRVSRLVAHVALALALAGSVSFVVASQAAAQLLDEEELMEKRQEWQARYRRLLQDRVYYTETIATARKNYTQAQRRNYPRGGARQQFLVDAEEAEASLAATEKAIEEIFIEARQNDVPPGWLAEVEDDPASYQKPAAPESARDEADRAGRNPLYFDDDE